MNIADLFEHAVDAVPDNLALKVGDRTITYAALEADANRLAHYLQSRGVKPGDHVAVYAKNSIEHVVAVLAVVKIRAVNINVNYRYVEGELNYLFDNADVVALIHERCYAPLVAKCAPKHAKMQTIVAIQDVMDPDGAEDVTAFGGVLSPRRSPTRAPSATSASAAPTTSTSSTPAAPPASPRASCGVTRTSGGCSAAASTSTPASRSRSSTSPSRPASRGWSPSRSVR